MEITRIFDILENARKLYSHKTDYLACKENGKWVYYTAENYYQTVQNLSYGLLALGLQKGDRVASVSNNRPEWNFIDMALNQNGLVHVPIYPTVSETEYEYILKHCEPRILFISDKILCQKIEPIAKQISSIIDIYTFNSIPDFKNWNYILELGIRKANEFESLLTRIKAEIIPEDLATLIYTSGTTGNPKGVMLTHKNILSNLWGISQVFNFTESDTTLSFLPICHVFERTINYYFQKNGISIYYAENMGTISDNLREVRPTVFIAVPRVLESVYAKIIGVGKDLKGIKKPLFFWAVNLGLRFEFQRKNGWLYHFMLSIADRIVFRKWRESLGNRINIIVTGGAALQERLIRVFNAAGIPVVEGYGMTETSPVIAACNFLTGEVMIGTVGPVIPGMEVMISCDGEILVRGDSVMKGYYKEPELTSEVFDAEGWFHTGDVGILIDNKFLKITDRKKEIFKLSSGKYISPQVIENKLKESFFIEQAMIIGQNEKFASALISPNFHFLKKWATEHGVDFRNNIELITNLKVLANYQKEINEINKGLGQMEQIKRFRLVPEEWTQQTRELSPTLKLRRRHLYNEYREVIAEIYPTEKNGKI
jgi:long-chain acyl-CoA synthetase